MSSPALATPWEESLSGISQDDFGHDSSDSGLDESGQSLMDWDWECPIDDDPSLNGEGDSWILCERADLADGEVHGFSHLSMDDVDDEEDHRGPSYLSSESFASALSNLSDPRKERAKTLRQARLRVVSELDYDDPVQRKLVSLMHLRAKAILKKHPDAPSYLRWFFAHEKDQHGLEFDLCAISLGADPTAVRLHFQSYLYLHWVVLNAPIAFLVAQPPEDLVSKSTYYAGSVGALMMTRAWEWPGIPLRKLIEAATEKGYGVKLAYSAIEALQEKKYLLDWDENCYAVGARGRFLDKSNPWNFR